VIVPNLNEDLPSKKGSNVVEKDRINQVIDEIPDTLRSKTRPPSIAPVQTPLRWTGIKGEKDYIA
jgi:hypothetical protein